MKIAIVIDAFLSSSEIFLLRQLRYFLSQDYESVDIFANYYLDKPRSVKSDVSDISGKITFFKPLSGGKIKRLFQYTSYVLPRLLVKPRIWKWGWKFFIDTLIRKNSREKISTMLRALVLADKKYDVILAHYGPTAISIVEIMNNCNLSGKLIAHFHGHDATAAFSKPQYQKDIQKVFQAASNIIAVSTYMKDQLADKGCPAEKISIIPCGAPISQIPLSNKVSSQPCRFIGVANLIEVKGPLHTLKAFKKVLEECPDAHLLLIGGGHLHEPCQEFVRAEGMGNSVDLPGPQPNEAVLQELAKSSVFVQHNIKAPNGAVEGWGVCFAEAAAAGLPIVGTRHGGVTDIVTNDATGYLVEEGNWQEMAERMIELAKDSALRVKLGQAGRESIIKKGNCELQLKKLDDLLKSMGN